MVDQKPIDDPKNV